MVLSKGVDKLGEPEFELTSVDFIEHHSSASTNDSRSLLPPRGPPPLGLGTGRSAQSSYCCYLL